MTFFARLIPFTLALLFVTTAIPGQVTLAPDEAKTVGQRVPDVTLIDEDSTSFTLGSLAGKPIIISPVFTACQQTCPMITTSLRDALAEIGEPDAGYHVVTVSFDPADGPAQMREYRRSQSLPAGWKLAVATPENLRQLLDAIDFNYEAMPGGGFAHANVIAILNPALVISGYARGVSYTPEEIRRALEDAAREVSFVRHYRPYIIAVGVTAWLSVVAALYATRKKRIQAGADAKA